MILYKIFKVVRFAIANKVILDHINTKLLTINT